MLSSRISNRPKPTEIQAAITEQFKALMDASSRQIELLTEKVQMLDDLNSRLQNKIDAQSEMISALKDQVRHLNEQFSPLHPSN